MPRSTSPKRRSAHERERVGRWRRRAASPRSATRAAALGYLDLLDAERNHFQAQLDEAGTSATA
jgi:hypothetical protein